MGAGSLISTPKLAGLMREPATVRVLTHEKMENTFGCISASRSQSAGRYDLPIRVRMLVASVTGFDPGRNRAVVLTEGRAPQQ